MGVIRGRIEGRGSGGGRPSIPIPAGNVATAAAPRPWAADLGTLPVVLLTHRTQGGIFKWAITSAADDGGTVFNAGGYGASSAGWRRIFSGEYNVQWFGALGDGVSDDTSAINIALLALKSRG